MQVSVFVGYSDQLPAEDTSKTFKVLVYERLPHASVMAGASIGIQDFDIMRNQDQMFSSHSVRTLYTCGWIPEVKVISYDKMTKLLSMKFFFSPYVLVSSSFFD
tara:strand:- start:222 stop:533 length:312 start_codon:yes stop_codon:yes gene_type:complete